jgi:hypothetical protein
MQRILIASPVRGGVSPNYIKSLFSIMLSKQNKLLGGPFAPYEVDWAMTSGTSVAMARDELADMAIRRKFDRLVFWDIDLGSADAAMTVSMFYRLISHDVDIVAGQYVGHNFLSQFHGATVENAELRPDGLMEMAQIPLGFSAIKVSALLKIKEKLPHFTYMLKETCMKEAKPDMFEFFPNGVVGPNSADGKLARIRDSIKKWESKEIRTNEELLNRIIFTVDDKDYSTNIMLGEDFYFCKLARDSGLKLHIDNNLIVPHDTGVKLPVKNQDILQALVEPWRLHNDAHPDKVRELVEKLSPLLCQDIPA